MAVVEISKIQVRRGQENQTGIPVLAGGEFGWAADTEHLYIGLRRDDGGARDANVRILTENDVLSSNLFNAETLNTYTYRNDTYPAITGDPNTQIAVVRDINKKLDDFVNIKDFGVTGEGGDVNDWELIQNAIDRLFLDPLKSNSVYGPYSAKVLYFPAGVYNIDQPILVPAYTTIVGEGIGKTIINLTSISSHAIQTIDADVNDISPSKITFDNGTITSGGGQPNYLHIEGLTIQYDSSVSVQGCLSLLSVDCSENAIIRDVRFVGQHVAGAGDDIDNGHSGISIRGYSSASEQISVSSNNTLIDNCEFEGLYYGVISNYDIVNPIIQNCQFSNSIRGITFNDPIDLSKANVGPRGGRIINNRFVVIEHQAIFVGSGSSNLSTDHVSMNNRFYDVGNGGDGRASIGDFITPVITFLTNGNITTNDWFDRQEFQKGKLGISYKYPLLVEGKTTINDTGVNSIVINSGTTPILRFPITSQTQNLTIKYTLTQGAPESYTIDRTGEMLVYIQPGTTPNGTVTDSYTFVNGEGNINWALTIDAGNSYYELTATTGLSNITFKYQTNLMI